MRREPSVKFREPHSSQKFVLKKSLDAIPVNASVQLLNQSYQALISSYPKATKDRVRRGLRPIELRLQNNRKK